MEENNEIKFENRSLSQPPEIWRELERIANRVGFKRSLSKVARIAFIEFIQKYEDKKQLKALKSQLYFNF